jgi:orotidine-5'-phosphate decarboxylase
MNPHERILFAADFPNLGEATRFIQKHRLHTLPLIGGIKVGLELFLGAGPEAVRAFRDVDLPVMLDLKLHDIPETVARAVKVGGDLGVKFMTLHVQQRAAMEQAAKAAEAYPQMTLLGVTVLTSMTESDLNDLCLFEGRSDTWYLPEDRARYLAKFAWSCGIKGLVCSAQDLGKIRINVPEATFVVPGIRPAGSAAGDQKRVGTPAEAVKAGAGYLVVGRPIRDATDPVAACKDIAAEIATVDDAL